MNRFKNNSQNQLLSGSIPQFWSQMAGLAFVAVAYWAAVRLGLLFVAQPEGVASIWPASGLALAVLLLSPKRQWTRLLAVIFVTNAAGNWSGGNSLPASLGFALANMLEALLGAWVLTHFCRPRITFRNTLEIFVLFGVAIFSNGITALLGAAVPTLAFGAPFMNTWLVWWTSDGLGMILVTPLIVTWASGQNIFQSVSPWRLVETVLLTLALAIFAWLLFGNFTIAEEPILRNYMLFPILIWLAFRYSPRGMASALTLLAAIAIRNTLQGCGIFGFADQTVTEHLVSVQMLLIVSAFTGLLLSAIVTERKEGEEKLRESEDKFKYIFEYSNVGKSITLISGKMHVNMTFSEMLGFSPEELRNKGWQDITHPDDVELTQKEVDALLAGEKDATRFTKRFLKKDGSIIWVDLSSSLRRDEAGKPLYLITTLVDITARKQAEDALRESEEKWHSLVSASPDYIALHDSEGRYLFLNHYAEGFTEKDVIGSSAFEYLAPESKDLFKKKMEECLNTLTLQKFEYSAMGDQGTFKMYEQYLVPIINTKKEIEILAIARDITERKRMEDALQHSEKRYRQLFENMHEGFLIQDVIKDESGKPVDVRYLEINPAIERFLGKTRAEIIGRARNQVLKIPDPAVVDAISQVANTGQPFHLVQYSSGAKKWYESFSYLFGPGQVATLVLDITERKQAEETLKDYNTRLEAEVSARTRELRDAQEHLVRQEKLAVLGQLAGGVGHELRNPLAVINNAVYFLKLIQPDANEKIKEHLGMIERETHNAEKIISDLLDFARVKSAEREAVSVSDIIQRVLARFPAPSSVVVSLDFPPDLPQVFADPHQMEQIFGNLVVNACQAMVSSRSASTSGVSNGGHLTISAVAKNDFVAVAVKDTGTGISPENMNKLFEPLFTTKIKGIGLGLAVSKRLAEANEGRIEVQSEAGKGSTFTIWLPSMKDEQ